MIPAQEIFHSWLALITQLTELKRNDWRNWKKREIIIVVVLQIYIVCELKLIAGIKAKLILDQTFYSFRLKRQQRLLLVA